MTGLYAVRVPAGWAPDWPAFPIDARCHCMDEPIRYSNVGPDHDGSPDECPDCDMGVIDLPALLGPRVCERCDGEVLTAGTFGVDPLGLKVCPDCSDGKVHQRVALVTERTCERCGDSPPRRTGQVRNPAELRRQHVNTVSWVDCPACAGSGVRLVATHTAQVDAVVPIVHHDECRAAVTDPYPAHVCVWPSGMTRLIFDANHGKRLPLADWSPGRWAVLTSDVQPFAAGSFTVDRLIRPFTGIAQLSDVLA